MVTVITTLHVFHVEHPLATKHPLHKGTYDAVRAKNKNGKMWFLFENGTYGLPEKDLKKAWDNMEVEVTLFGKEVFSN